MDAPKPKGFGQFDNLMRKLVKVPADALDTKGTPMTDDEFESRLRKIAEIARAQKEGGYTPQSDAMQALALIETLAILLIEEAAAHGTGK